MKNRQKWRMDRKKGNHQRYHDYESCERQARNRHPVFHKALQDTGTKFSVALRRLPG